MSSAGTSFIAISARRARQPVGSLVQQKRPDIHPAFLLRTKQLKIFG
jgi:translation initiation factor 2B subunit (eIF-2B alpha/beta/delta family)